MKPFALGTLLALSLLPGTAAAQGRVQFTFAGVAGQEIVNSRVGDVNDRLSGLVLGGEGVLISDRLMVRVRYTEGRMNPKAGSSTEARDVVSGEALVGFRATPWLSLWLGPNARAYTVGDSDQRWLVWSGRASARGTILPGRVQTFVELWGVFSGNVGNPSLKAGGRGAQGGLEARLGEGNFWGRLGYRIESLHANGLRETVETLGLSVIYGFPQ
jgi:hypothetical protein